MRRRRVAPAVVAALTLATALAACSGGTSGGARDGDTRPARSAAHFHPADESAPVESTVPEPPASEPAAGGSPTGGALGLFPERVYVPNSGDDTVSVIDPKSFRVVDTYRVGRMPHHVTPSPDMKVLYVDNTAGNSLTVIDPMSGRPTGEIPVIDPYNMYFTPDGVEVVVVAERYRRLDFRDPKTFALLASVEISPPGADHLAFSPDGRYLYVSTEFAGDLAKVDVWTHTLVGMVHLGGKPVDVLRLPDGLLLVANQERNGVSLVEPDSLKEIAFRPTGRGAHGLLLSRDRTKVYVSNRLQGTISLLDARSLDTVATWDLGDASPDMGLLNPDGSQLWITGRYHACVYAVDTASGRLLAKIPVGKGAHGLTYFPTLGDYTVGHNGVTITAAERDAAARARFAWATSQR
jgi:YVTN family beta-propeller protein